MTAFMRIWRKELAGEFYTWKSMLWLVVASLLFSFTSYLLLTNKELSLLDQTELLWLLGKTVVGVALLMVAIDASSIMNVEFEKETAESLFLAPVRLSNVVLGKLAAVLTLWAAIYAVSLPYVVVTASGSRLAPAFAGYVALLGTLAVTGFALLILGASLLFRSSKNTLTTALIVLLALTTPALFTSTLKTDIVSQVFSAMNPVDNVFNSLDNVLVDFQTSLLQNGRFLLPLLAFCALAVVFLAFCMRRFSRQGIVKND